jgi:hypothetical protein
MGNSLVLSPNPHREPPQAYLDKEEAAGVAGNLSVREA